MIKVENVKKQFIKTNNKKEKIPFYAVNGISFTANDNEIIGILGPNGAGKTTLLRIVAGIMNATSGEVSIDDMNYKENAIEIKKTNSSSTKSCMADTTPRKRSRRGR